MLFPTLDFGLFFLLVFAASWVLRERPEGRKALLVAASYFFYGYWNWRFCFLMLAGSLIDYAAGRLIDGAAVRRVRRAAVTAAIVLQLLILGYFKYYNFFIESLNDLLFSLGLHRELPFLEIVLPVGISFYTFHGISYVVDVYRRDIRAARSLLDVMLYISFFPVLVAGPIVRASWFLPQIEAKPDPHRILASMGLLLVVTGLFKKVVLANYLATELVDPVFFDAAGHGGADLLLAVYGYALQIYCDFSAYSDIAIGVAALLGYRFQRNFDQPYRAESLRDFWRRWHIALSTWLRDYLYIPLGGSRHGRWAMVRNLLITMLLGGIWHGAAWTFVIWGALHGTGLAVERLMTGDAPPLRRPPVWRRTLAVVLVFHFVCLAWIFFRSQDLAAAVAFLAGFADWSLPAQHLTPFILALLAFGIATQFVPPDTLERVERWFRLLPPLSQGALTGLAIVAINAFGPERVAPFIYFQF